jgi:hypothetical protein
VAALRLKTGGRAGCEPDHAAPCDVGLTHQAFGPLAADADALASENREDAR